MTFEELSPEEENHLYNLSGIPFLATFISIMIYFVYLMQHDVLKSVTDFLMHIGLLLATIPPVTMSLAFEILYSRKVKVSPRFHIKRFSGRTVIILAGTLSLLALFGVFSKVVPLPIDEGSIFLCSFVIWISIWFVIVIKFKQSLNKLTKGHW